MTWVVGTSTLFGYGVIVSDVQVSCEISGCRMDVLQKAYPVGKYIVAGFAGHVHTGLTLLGSLGSFLNSLDVPDDECWDRQWVADNWPIEARKIFHELAEHESVSETHILMLGLKPAGTPEKRVMGGAIGHISVFRSPDFLPESEVGGRKAMSVGCGRYVKKYTATLEKLICDNDLTYMKSEIYNPGGYGRRIAETLGWMAKDNPVDGISTHFQLFIVRMGEIKQWNPSGMPKLARDWEQLLKMLDKNMDSEALVADCFREHHS